ncbi:hypothetical protein HK101_006577, partial [Irineochytrium annulatum]
MARNGPQGAPLRRRSMGPLMFQEGGGGPSALAPELSPLPTMTVTSGGPSSSSSSAGVNACATLSLQSPRKSIKTSALGNILNRQKNARIVKSQSLGTLSGTSLDDAGNISSDSVENGGALRAKLA